MNRILILLPVISIFCCGIIHAQSTVFKKYTNQQYKFSFDIPDYWAIRYSKAEGGLVCVPVTVSEKEQYRDCFEGIVFRMDLFRASLESTLDSQGNYTKAAGTYYTRDRTMNIVKVKSIKGINWNGAYHDNVCGIACESTGFHAGAGRCEFIYFSNGSTTICIDTNGREFDERILKRLLASFRFYK